MMFDSNLGPLARLQGVWEGERGRDLAPSDKPETDREVALSTYRERMVFEPAGRVDNHEQILYGLRYATTVWRLGEPNPFHEEVGYWLWDAEARMVMRSFMPPRGMAILAGGRCEADADGFHLEAESGSEKFGICSSPFLLREFKTIRYTLDLHFEEDDEFFYEEHMWMRVKGREALFDHSDQNQLRRTPS